MNAAAWIVILIGTAALAFFAGFDLCWRTFVVRRGRRSANPNPFGELPPVQPLGAVFGDESMPCLDVNVVTRRLEPIGIATITIRHNQPEARN